MFCWESSILLLESIKISGTNPGRPSQIRQNTHDITVPIPPWIPFGENEFYQSELTDSIV